jgi:GNAT superfamily N-acetyltransferase
MLIRIEKADETDVPQIIEMLREFADFENLSEYCQITEDVLRDAMFGAKPCVEGLIALADEKPIGYALFYENFASFRGQRGIYLEDLYVKTEFRGQKVGESFLKKIAQIVSQRNGQRIDFQVLDWNKNAVGFYEKLGAEIDADERHFRFVGEALQKLAE